MHISRIQTGTGECKQFEECFRCKSLEQTFDFAIGNEVFEIKIAGVKCFQKMHWIFLANGTRLESQVLYLEID